MLGTLAYMAPEQSDGHEAGAAADLYSLALVLYEALSGVNPVRGPTPAATARRIGRPLPALERHRGDLPRELTRALDAALAPEPEDRGTLAELRHALRDALERPSRRTPLRRRHAATTARPPVRRDPAGPYGPAQPEHAAAGGYAVPGAEAWPGDPREQPQPDAAASGWPTAPRIAWLAAAAALCAWQIGAGRPGVALLALCAALPVVLVLRRPGPRWLAAGLAPLLGLAGLAGAYPALAGQAARWRSRALLGALGYWWLALAGPLLAGAASGGSLWLSPPAGTGGGARGVAWESSASAAAAHAVGPLLGIGLLLGAAVWALAATLLPWVVRGRNALLDAAAAIAWAAALACAVALLDRGLPLHATQPAPRGALLGAALGAATAIAARAVRGRVGESIT